MELIRTTSESTDFQRLAAELEHDLSIRDGERPAGHAQLNHLGATGQALVAYQDGRPVGCGAIRRYDDTAMEIKRMYVVPENRGRGLAGALLKELEGWAGELGYQVCILETGLNQPEAIRCYEKNGYASIPRFGKYKDNENSVCFEKQLPGAASARPPGPTSGR